MVQPASALFPAAGPVIARILFVVAIGGLSCDRSTHPATRPPDAETGAAAENAGPVAPVAERRPHEVVSPHGKRSDEYYWLRDDERTDPDVLGYLEAENTYKEAMLAPVAALRQHLFEEIVGRIKQDDSTVPYRDRGYLYYSRYEEGGEYPVHARKRGSVDAEEEVVLDVPALAENSDFYSLADWAVSDDASLVAYAEDRVGRRQFTLRFTDLRSGKTLPDRISNTTGSMAWASDGKTLFYVEQDPVTLLGVRVKKHVLGSEPSRDPVVYEEKDHAFYLNVGRTSDRRYVVIDLGSTVSSELHFIPADDPNAEPRVLAPRARDVEYDADHIGRRWVIRTNDGAKNFRVMQVSDRRTGDRSRWRELIPHSAETYIEGLQVFESHLAIGERSEGLQRIRIREWKSGKETFVRSEEPAYSAHISVNEETDSEWLRYSYTSLTTPRTIYDVNMKTGERRLLKRDPVLGGFAPEHYATERVWARARDGVEIPISLVYRRGFQRDGSAPLYQYGYGSYGASMDPAFRSHVLSLLDRGFVYAIAHVRGGQEMGRAWYEDGKLLRKMNTFTDFIDVTEHLVAERYADPDAVVAVGGSAGGLLMGAVANLRPDLYRVIVAQVPFVDVVTTMLDESIPLTTNEFDEWGDPREKEYYDYMLSYSPYDNVRAADYPAMLVTTGLWDSQVQYFEPTKWVARLRATKTDRNPLLLHANMEAGHGGASGRFRRQKERALEFAFVLQQLGMAGPGRPPATRAN